MQATTVGSVWFLALYGTDLFVKTRRVKVATAFGSKLGEKEKEQVRRKKEGAS